MNRLGKCRPFPVEGQQHAVADDPTELASECRGTEYSSWSDDPSPLRLHYGVVTSPTCLRGFDGKFPAHDLTAKPVENYIGCDNCTEDIKYEADSLKGFAGSSVGLASENSYEGTRSFHLDSWDSDDVLNMLPLSSQESNFPLKYHLFRESEGRRRQSESGMGLRSSQCARNRSKSQCYDSDDLSKSAHEWPEARRLINGSENEPLRQWWMEGSFKRQHFLDQSTTESMWSNRQRLSEAGSLDKSLNSTEIFMDSIDRDISPDWCQSFPVSQEFLSTFSAQSMYDSNVKTKQQKTSKKKNSLESIPSKKTKKRKGRKLSTSDGNQEGEISKNNSTTIRCFNCDGIGHLSRRCSQKRACYFCGSTDHVVKDCKYSMLLNERYSKVDSHAVDDRANTSKSIDGAATSRGVNMAIEGVLHVDVEQSASTDTSSIRPNAIEKKDQNHDVTLSNGQNSTCMNCNQKGHRTRNCPHVKKCFHCGETGHIVRDCSKASRLWTSARHASHNLEILPAALNDIIKEIAVAKDDGKSALAHPYKANDPNSNTWVTEQSSVFHEARAPSLSSSGSEEGLKMDIAHNQTGINDNISLVTSACQHSSSQDEVEEDRALQGLVSNMLTCLELTET